MLSDEQRAAIYDELAGFPATDGRQQSHVSPEDAYRMMCDIAPLVEQWISEAVADALESGELPDGWDRTHWGRPSIHGPGCPPRRTVVTGPWREVEG